MDKEVKKAIKNMKQFVYGDGMSAVSAYDMKVVLKALKNYIPKEVIEEKIKKLKNIAKKKDIMPEPVTEEKLDESIIYSSRFNVDGYISEAIITVLQDILEGK